MKTKLFQKDFTLIVIGQVISLFGNAVLRFALPLYLLRETGSSALFGIVTACSFLPVILLSMVGGILADRINKRNIMVILDFSTAVLIIIFYIVLGRVPVVPLFIIVLMALYGISGIYQPSVQASIPAVVAEDKLMAGNAVINQVTTLSGLLGPVVGGMLFGMWGITPILIISIACFIFSAVMEMFIIIPYEKRPNEKHILAIAGGDLKESFQFVKTEKPIFFSVSIIVAVFNLVLSSVMIIGIPVLIVQILKLSDQLLGFAQGVCALGGLAGGILAAVIAAKLKFHQSHVLLAICAGSVGIMGVALLMDGSAMVSYIVIMVMSFIGMAVATLFTVQMFTMVQKETPPQLIGKVMAALISIAMCAQPVGQLIYGLLFDVFSDYAWTIMVGASAAAFLVSLYSNRVFRKVS